MILTRVAVLSTRHLHLFGVWCSTHPFMMWCTAKLGSLKLAWLSRKITLQWDIPITSLTLMMLETEYPGFGGQYHIYWCPGSKSCQAISRHGIGCVEQTTCIVVLEVISYTWLKPNPRQDSKCEYTFWLPLKQFSMLRVKTVWPALCRNSQCIKHRSSVLVWQKLGRTDRFSLVYAKFWKKSMRVRQDYT